MTLCFKPINVDNPILVFEWMKRLTWLTNKIFIKEIIIIILE